MFARFRNLFAKSNGDGEEAEEEQQQQAVAYTRPEVPSIVVDEAPDVAELAENETQTATETETESETNAAAAPLASEEEDLANGYGDAAISGSSQELSKLLEAINEASKLSEMSSEDAAEDEDEDDDDDETASTSSVKTKIAKASIERDIIFEESEEEAEQVDEENYQGEQTLKSLDKIKALIRNDSETYPQSDYTDDNDNDNETEEPTPSHSRTASLDSGATGPPDANPRLSGDFSVVADELPLDSSPSPLMHDSGRTSSASGSEVPGESAPAATLRIVPTGSNELACAAISHKLGAIAEVAESLDAVIRDVQQQQQEVGAGPAGMSITNGGSGGGHGHKKLASIEDWQSRSTEDESFATASEGNFTPNSHSSSFQTASYIGSAKNSFDEADDSTLSTFEIPELPPSPVNMSFDSSELSYFSAHQQQQQQQTLKCDDQDSVVGVAELHSQSVTPTPDEDQQQQQEFLLPLPLPQAIESDSEMEGFSLATGITTELAPRSSTAHTPEVSATRFASSTASASAAAAASAFDPDATNPNEPKPPASWRRSKYYENITKQTIKGFL